MSRRITLLAKGNLDLRDVLVRQGDRAADARWNGINELLRPRGVVARVRHETSIGAAAWLAARGVPPTLRRRGLDLGAYATQFAPPDLAGVDAVVLSVQPDLAHTLLRHRAEGWLFHAAGRAGWSAEDRAWLRAELEPVAPPDPAAWAESLEALIARLRASSTAPILVFNASAAVPGDATHTHTADDTLATRIRRFDLALVDVAARTGAAVVDVDRVVARLGADRALYDAFHFTPVGCAAVAAEVVRVLDDLGVLG